MTALGENGLMAPAQSIAASSGLKRPSLYSLQDRPAHTILLGGLGGDSHSVGLTILRHALFGQGFNVVYLGTQNSIETFVDNVSIADAVLVSCMDGHANHYLRAFPKLRAERGLGPTPWYLGGNPVVEDIIGAERVFLEMGFAQVFLRFVDTGGVVDALQRDLSAVEKRLAREETLPVWLPNQTIDLSTPVNEELDEETFATTRREVLEHWPTGRGAADMAESAAFLRASPSWARAHAEVIEAGGPPFLQPRSGVALETDQLALFNAFKSVGVRILSYQVDSLTRLNDYSGAAQAIAESRRAGASTINGFPMVNHGVPPLRRLIRALDLPLQTRHSTKDPRLLAEISCASGVTAYEGGAICYNIPYYRDYPLETSIRRWQYVDRLIGRYEQEYGVRIEREYFGVLTGTLIPPSLAIATGVLESLLALMQGVRCVGIGWAEQGCRRQDVAAIRAIPKIADEIFSGLGYANVAVHTCFHQYMAAFPELPTKAEELIYQSSITGALAGAPRIITKTPVEAFKIPSMADNLAGLALSMRGVAEAAERKHEAPDTAEEEAMIRKEVVAIVETVIALGHGDVAKGIVAAFRGGQIDIPFAPSVHNHGAVMTARDVDGAIRFLNFGNLPFDREIKAYHDDKMNVRRRLAKTKPGEDYKLLEHDVMMIPRGQYAQWPLDAEG